MLINKHFSARFYSQKNKENRRPFDRKFKNPTSKSKPAAYNKVLPLLLLLLLHSEIYYSSSSFDYFTKNCF